MAFVAQAGGQAAGQGATGTSPGPSGVALQRLALILACGLVGILVALAVLVFAPPRYRASAELALPSPAAAAVAEDALASEPVLRVVANVLATGTLMPDVPPNPDAPLSSETLARVQARLAARRTGERLVITASGDEAVETARLADAAAQALLVLADLPATPPPPARPDAAAEARLDRLAQELRDAEARLDRARAETGIAAATGGPAVEPSQLAALQARLSLARVRTAEERVRLAQMERLAASGADPDTVPEVVRSPVIAALRGDLAEARRLERLAATELGPRHPRLAAQREERRRIESQIRAETVRLAAAARQDVERAEAAERALSAEIEAQRAAMTAAIDAVARLRALEQAAERARTALDLARREAAAPAAPPAVERPAGRLVSAAVPPSKPEGLPPAALLALGLTAGCSIGAAFATAGGRRWR
ncbi:hypothetical protein [Blastochloris sulfoviridis]|uniref:Polysaccharide chain length determinant N-terminal domain-containing protein n=1 Tax=Blastochloris sulfoviridis TaxID=50712 RepID=A0A5M6I464_9HYPH|nr:hypothetical protein [Blastochloris sulfoviridis]KAA5602962.1 hypothetical protein F1193_03775 [Blastochloris sulfoviridis]